MGQSNCFSEKAGPTKDANTLAKEQQKVINRAIRQIEKDRTKMEKSEVEVLKKVKDLANKNQHGPAKILSKELVRSRAQVNKMYTMTTQMKSISMMMASTRMNAEMMKGLEGCSAAINNMNENMNMANMRETLKEFAK